MSQQVCVGQGCVVVDMFKAFMVKADGVGKGLQQHIILYIFSRTRVQSCAYLLLRFKPRTLSTAIAGQVS